MIKDAPIESIGALTTQEDEHILQVPNEVVVEESSQESMLLQYSNQVTEEIQEDFQQYLNNVRVNKVIGDVVLSDVRMDSVSNYRPTYSECFKCTAKVSNEGSLIRHLQNEHSDLDLLCDICGFVFESHELLLMHSYIHNRT